MWAFVPLLASVSAPRRARAGMKCPFPSQGLTCFPRCVPCLWPPHHGQAGDPRRESTASKGCFQNFPWVCPRILGREISFNQESPPGMEMGPLSP